MALHVCLSCAAPCRVCYTPSDDLPQSIQVQRLHHQHMPAVALIVKRFSVYCEPIVDTDLAVLEQQQRVANALCFLSGVVWPTSSAMLGAGRSRVQAMLQEEVRLVGTQPMAASTS